MFNQPWQWAMLAGGLAGFGVYVLVKLLMPPPPNIRSTLARLDAEKYTSHAQISSAFGSGNNSGLRVWQTKAGTWLERQAHARGRDLHRMRADLDIMGTPLALKLGEKVLLGIGGLFFGMFISGALVAALGLPPFTGLIIIFGAAFGGFMLPDLALKSEAEKRRADFRHVIGSFLDLVAMNLAGGRGLPEALLSASTIGDHWAMLRIRQALAEGRLLGITPWEALGQLGANLRVDELRDLAAALALAGDEGAKIRASLNARSATLRRRELSEIEGQAGEKSQSMLVAQLVMVAAFMLFLGYPAAAQLMSAM